MRVVQIPTLLDNYTYLVICGETGKCGIVDSPDSQATIDVIERAKVAPAAILSTHHHWDHVGGNEELARKYNIPVYGGENDKDRLPGLIHPLKEGDSVTIGSLTLKILFIPGHTKGHIAYVTDGAVFCGDTLFAAGCGRLFEGTPERMVSSLTKLKNLPDDTKVYCGHEYTQKNLEFALTLEPENPSAQKKYDEVVAKRKKGESTVPTTIAEEKSYNPFLRWDSPELIVNLKKKIPALKTDPVTIFAATRHLKDHY